jgi:arylsulfatase A-like enzyme
MIWEAISRDVLRGLALLAAAGAVACGAGGPGEDAETLAVRLVQRMGEAEVRNRAATPEVAPTVWRFDGSTPGLTPAAAAGWRSTGVRDGVWHGTTAAPKAVLELASEAVLGGGDDVWAVEVRMRVSAGERLRLTVLGADGPPGPAFAAPDGPPAGFVEELVPGEMTTYRIERARQFPLGPSVRREARRVVLLPTDAPGAEVEIESVRLVFRREHLAGLPTGIGWYDLAQVWKESVVSRPGEEIVFTVDLPERPLLDLSVGTVARRPVAVEVEVAAPGAEPVRRRRVLSRPEVWEPWQIDLARLAEGAEGGGGSATITLRSRSVLSDAVSFWGAPVVRSRRSGPAAPGAAAPQGVIVFLSDTLRRDHLALYGYGRETAPVLGALAAEGVVFDDAVVQGTWTKVSVPSILASQYPSTHGIVSFTDRLPAAATTLAEVFRDAGYATFQTSSVPFSGQLTNLHQGVEELHERAALGDGQVEGSRSKTARPWMDRLLPWIEAKREVPFFALLHTMDAHHPFPPRAPFDTEWGEEGALELHAAEEETVRPFIDNPLLANFTTPHRSDLLEAGLDPRAWVEREIDWLDGSILAQDAELDRLLAHLEALGLRDRVVIAFLSDHGTELLDHDSHWHGTTVYSELTDVPLLLWGPGFLPRGARVDEPVEMIDVFPTLVELAGLEVPETAQGRSLMPLLQAAASGGGAGWRPKPRFSERESMDPELTTYYPARSTAIFDGRWKLVRHIDPPEGLAEIQLFDRARDRADTTNLADRRPEVVAALLRKLDRWQVWAREQRVDPGAQGELSAEELRQLESLGYL